ncbi:MAG: hypothetical protein ACXW2X_06905 [Thermoanaerobaculia bacterium]
MRALAVRAPRVGTLQLAAYQVANKFFEAMRGIELPLALFAGAAALVLIGAGRFSFDAALRIEDRWRKKKTAAEAAVMSAPHS